MWISGSGNGTCCLGYLIGHASSCAPLSRSKYSALACLLVEDTESIVTPVIQPFCSSSGLHERAPIAVGVCEGYDTIEAGSFPQNVHVFAYPFAFLLTLAFLRVAVVTGGIVVRSTWSPAVFRPMSSSATVLARVDVCRARVGRADRAISFWLRCLPLPFPLPFLRESTCIRSSSALAPFPADTVGFAPKFREEQHHCNKAVRRAALLAYVPNCKLHLKNWCLFHHHCVLDCICQRSSRSAFSFSDIQIPGSQSRVSQAS